MTQTPRAEIATPAGFGPYRRKRFRRIRHELSSFIAKNKGLVTNPEAWSMLRRLHRMRRAGGLPDDGTIRFVSGHHKVMTTYFNAVLRLLGYGLRLPYEQTLFQQPRASSRLVLAAQSRLDLEKLGTYRGIHLLRDPRDMIVSGYHYHKWTYEDWVHRPDQNGESYQQKLNRLDQNAGLFLEIDHFIYSYRDVLTHWPVDDPAIREFTFEGLMGPTKRALYRDIFEHLGLEGDPLDLAVDLMTLFEASSRTGRKPGVETQRAHVRSASSGQWQKTLTPEHLDYIDTHLRDVLVKFGYA